MRKAAVVIRAHVLGYMARSVLGAAPHRPSACPPGSPRAPLQPPLIAPCSLPSAALPARTASAETPVPSPALLEALHPPSLLLLMLRGLLHSLLGSDAAFPLPSGLSWLGPTYALGPLFFLMPVSSGFCSCKSLALSHSSAFARSLS